jgi:hypothetical protein
MKQRIKFWYVMILMSIITFGFLFSFYQEYWRIRIIDINSPLKVLTPVVRRGESLIYQADYCLYKKFPTTVSRTLVNDAVIVLPDVSSVGKLGCHKAEIQLGIPAEAQPGRYYMEGLATYQVSPRRSVVVEFSTEEFLVTK